MTQPSGDDQRKRDPMTILLAEDDPDDRMLTLRALDKSKLPHEVYWVENGEELIDYLRQQGPLAEEECPRPDLILLDLNMPRVDGREALERIQEDPDLRRIPVVVLTTSEAEQDVLKSYDLGVNAFITKPVSFEGLLEAIRVIDRFWFDLVRLPSSQ